MKLDREDIDAIAVRVIEVIEVRRVREPRPLRYVDAATVARALGVERDWVYIHADELGAIRLSGPQGRLRFDLDELRQRLERGAAQS